MSLKKLGLAALVAASALVPKLSFSQEPLLEYRLTLGRHAAVGSFSINTNNLSGTLSLPLVKDISISFTEDDSVYTERFAFHHDETFTYRLRGDTVFFDDYHCEPANEEFTSKYGSQAGKFSSGELKTLDLIDNTFSGNFPDTMIVILYAREYKLLTTKALAKNGTNNYALSLRPLPFDKEAIGTFYIEDDVEVQLAKRAGVYIPTQLFARITLKDLPWLKFKVQAELVKNSPRIANLIYDNKTGVYHERTD